MMGPGGITVALAMYWLTGVVGAASLPPDDQYSPQQPPHRKDVSQGPRGYPTWLKYQQDPAARLESPDNTPDASRLEDSDFSREKISRKNSVMRDLDLVPLAPEGWNTAADITGKLSKSARMNPGVLEDSETSAVSVEDHFVEDDGFQDQGPGSVEVYKLDLHRENSLLVPHANGKQPVVGTRTKSKIPKKARAEEILWKLKFIDSSKASLPAIFQQPPYSHRDSTLPRQSRPKIKENRKNEVFAVGGVPELQVGCEGLEASERDKRSSGPGVEDIDEIDWDNSHKYQDPVYRESTEPILLRVTPIVLDLEEEEPPSGEIYEELDELLKLKKMESTSPKPTTRRWNRADIDPALEMDKHHEERTRVETFPERGDLGPSNGSVSEVKEKSIAEKDLKDRKSEKSRFRRNAVDESLNRHGGRKLFWVQHPERQGYDNQITKTRHHQDDNDHSDLWGFGEEDGDLSGSEEDAEVDKLREAEAEKRRREYERRRQEELERRRAGHGHRPHENHPSKSSNTNSEIERIRQEYARQLEKEQRERQRIEEERRRQRDHRRGGEEHPRRLEETKRRQEEESRRRLEEEERRNQESRRREEEDRRREWNKRREEEEERLRRLENQRNRQDPPSPLMRPEPSHRPGNISRSQQEKEVEERKLREYIERNRPIDPKKIGDRRRPEDQSTRNDDYERRKYMEAQQRRQMEEHRRRHPNEVERQRQVEEHRRRQQQPDEDQRRRQMEEQRRRDHPQSRAMEEERRRRLEEERKLQEYVRRNQPVNVPRRNNSEASISSAESRDLEEQKRTLEAARQWDRNRRPLTRVNDGRIHGPSAPTSIGQRQSQYDLEDMRRRQEKLEEERRRDSEWRRLAEEERRREAEIQLAESRRHEEERRRLEEAARRDEENRRAQSEGRRNSWQESVSSRRPATGWRRYDPNDEVRDREAEELRRQEAAERTTGNGMRNRDNEWRRRSEEQERQRKQEEERERQRLENERNFWNNEHRRTQYEDSGPKLRNRGESVRGGHDDLEWRRREHARLNSLPVRATIVIRSDSALKNNDGALPGVTLPTSSEPSIPSFGSRGNFGNEIDFPAINPNRPGLAVQGFPAAPTTRPPVKSPGACVWAIVQCCPANNRLTTCFESMGCPGVNWDPNPCRSSLADAARAEVIRFYAAADEANTRP